MAHPRDIYLHYSPYLELFTGVSTALSINEGIIKVVGPEGSGKTAFCRQLEEHLIQQGQDVIYFESPPESSDYLFGQIQNLLGLDKNRNFNKSLTEYLLAKSAPDNKLYVIYDDAEKIDKELFILIRLLNNIHNDSETLVSQVICGTDRLDELFDDPDLRSLTQYLNQSFTLSPMNRNELEDFCSGYKKETENKGRQLSSKELTDIFMLSNGLPGKTLELLEKALAPEFVDTKTEATKETAIVTPEQDDDISVLEQKNSDSEDLALSTSQDEMLDEQSPETTAEEVTYTEETAIALEPHELDTPEIVEQSHSAQEPEPEPEFAIESENVTESVTASSQQEVLQDDSELAQIDALPDPAFSNAGSAENMEEINTILAKEPELGQGTTPPYFKLTLSVIVIIVTMILAVVISGENETVNSQLARIFTEDTPLYMDQVVQDNSQASSPESNIDDNLIAESNDPDPVVFNPPVQPEEIIAETEFVETEIVNPATIDTSENEFSITQDNTVDTQFAASEVPEFEEITDSSASFVETELDIPATIDPSGNELPIIQDISTDAESSASEEPESVEITAVSVSEEVITEELPEEEMVLDEPATEQSIEAEVATTITRWLEAWEDGNIEAYLAFYHENYIPSSVESYALWENQRRERIEGATGISTDYDRLETLETTEGVITIQFWLYYSRNSYMDETLKELRLGKEDGNWRILEERNIEVIVVR